MKSLFHKAWKFCSLEWNEKTSENGQAKILIKNLWKLKIIFSWPLLERRKMCIVIEKWFFVVLFGSKIVNGMGAWDK